MRFNSIEHSLNEIIRSISFWIVDPTVPFRIGTISRFTKSDLSRNVLHRVDLDFLFMGAREEHGIDFVTIRAINKEVIAFKSLLQNNLSLVVAPEYNWVAADTTTLTTTIPDEANQVLAQLF